MCLAHLSDFDADKSYLNRYATEISNLRWKGFPQSFTMVLADEYVTFAEPNTRYNDEGDVLWVDYSYNGSRVRIYND